MGLLQAISLAAQTVETPTGVLRYDLLVGADGASSMVRDAMQAQVRVALTLQAPRHPLQSGFGNASCLPPERGSQC